MDYLWSLGIWPFDFIMDSKRSKDFPMLDCDGASKGEGKENSRFLIWQILESATKEHWNIWRWILVISLDISNVWRWILH